jgi:hypothetical protein
MHCLVFCFRDTHGQFSYVRLHVMFRLTLLYLHAFALLTAKAYTLPNPTNTTMMIYRVS